MPLDVQSNKPHSDRLVGARLTLMELLAIAQELDQVFPGYEEEIYIFIANCRVVVVW
jgi:hypothetical protein